MPKYKVTKDQAHSAMEAVQETLRSIGVNEAAMNRVCKYVEQIEGRQSAVTDDKLRESIAHYNKLFGVGVVTPCTGANEATDKMLIGIPDFAKCVYYLSYIESSLSELSQLRAEANVLKSALGCHFEADAYRDTFPDNEDDKKYLRKQETFWRIIGRNLVSYKLKQECCEAAKKVSIKTPTEREVM